MLNERILKNAGIKPVKKENLNENILTAKRIVGIIPNVPILPAGGSYLSSFSRQQLQVEYAKFQQLVNEGLISPLQTKLMQYINQKLNEAATMEESAPPGFPEALMFKLKKQYAGNPSKAFATAWAIHNKHMKEGCSLDEAARAYRVADDVQQNFYGDKNIDLDTANELAEALKRKSNFDDEDRNAAREYDSADDEGKKKILAKQLAKFKAQGEPTKMIAWLGNRGIGSVHTDIAKSHTDPEAAKKAAEKTKEKPKSMDDIRFGPPEVDEAGLTSEGEYEDPQGLNRRQRRDLSKKLQSTDTTAADAAAKKAAEDYLRSKDPSYDVRKRARDSERLAHDYVEKLRQAYLDKQKEKGEEGVDEGIAFDPEKYAKMDTAKLKKAMEEPEDLRPHWARTPIKPGKELPKAEPIKMSPTAAGTELPKGKIATPVFGKKSEPKPEGEPWPIAKKKNIETGEDEGEGPIYPASGGKSPLEEMELDEDGIPFNPEDFDLEKWKKKKAEEAEQEAAKELKKKMQGPVPMPPGTQYYPMPKQPKKDKGLPEEPKIKFDPNAPTNFAPGKVSEPKFKPKEDDDDVYPRSHGPLEEDKDALMEYYRELVAEGRVQEAAALIKSILA